MNIINRTCRPLGGSKQPSFGVECSNTTEFCAEHKEDNMVSPHHFGVKGSRTREFCALHKKERIWRTSLLPRGVVTLVAMKRPNFGVQGTEQ